MSTKKVNNRKEHILSSPSWAVSLRDTMRLGLSGTGWTDRTLQWIHVDDTASHDWYRIGAVGTVITKQPVF